MLDLKNMTNLQKQIYDLTHKKYRLKKAGKTKELEEVVTQIAALQIQRKAEKEAAKAVKAKAKGSSEKQEPDSQKCDCSCDKVQPAAPNVISSGSV